jgi:pimeloyl-ACP methyl ester carboxylesterase
MRRFTAVILLWASTAWAASSAPPLRTTTLGRGPTLVMIHNLGGTRKTWMPTVRKLPGYRVVLVDLPGHGGSPFPQPFTIDAGAAAIDRVLAAQNGESTVVVAQGLGALMALRALEVHPERARGLLAIEMSLRKQFAVADDQREKFFKSMDDGYDQFLKEMFLNMGRDSAQGVAIHAQASHVPPRVMKAYIREMGSFDPALGLDRVKTPLLLVATDRIWGAAKDSSAFVKMMGYDKLHSFTLRHLTNCGFLVASDQPDSLAMLISDFARRVRAAR